MASAENKTPWLSLKETAIMYCEQSSMHGLRVVGDPSAAKARRIFWALLVMTGVVFVIYQGIMLCLKALYPGIQTEIAMDASWEPLIFPAITICNYNKYRLSYLKDHPLAKQKVINLWEIYEKKVNETIDGSKLKDVNITLIAIEAAHQLDKWSLCAFGRKRNHTGISSGLQLLLNAETTEYFLTGGLSRASGFKVMVHEPDEVPRISSLGLAISPGTETQIALSKSEYTLDSAMNCVNTTSESFINPLHLYTKYTFEACVSECIIKYIAKFCGCKPYQLPGPYEPCDTIESISCSNERVGLFGQDKVNGTGNCTCPDRCHKVNYETRMSSAKYPATFYQIMAKKLFNISTEHQRYVLNDSNLSTALGNQMKENMIALNVYFETLAVRVTKLKYDYSWDSLGGDLGGYMGLMVGASILTVIELLEFLIILLNHALRKTKHVHHINNEMKENQDRNSRTTSNHSQGSDSVSGMQY